MKDTKMIKRKALLTKHQTVLRTAAQSAIYHARKTGHESGQELSETAEASSQRESAENYAESKVISGVVDSGNLAGIVTLEAVRLPYAKYRAIQEKRASQIYAAESHSIPLTSAETIPSTEVNASRSVKSNAPLHGQRRRIQMSFIKDEAIQNKYIQAAQNRTFFQKSRSSAIRHSANSISQSKSLAKSVRNISHGAKKTITKMMHLLMKAIHAVCSAVIAVLPAGAIVVLCILFIGIIAVLLASPMGILFAEEINDPNSISISAIITEANEAFGKAINDLVTAHSECSEVNIQYDYEDGHTWASYWPEVLAVFAVNSNLNSDIDVLIIDDAKKQQLLDTFWLMHNIRSEIISEEIEIEVPDDIETDLDVDTDSIEPPTHIEIQTILRLNITVSSRTVEELAADFNFSNDQIDTLHQLLSPEIRPYLSSLTTSESPLPGGTLIWPLSGYRHISTHFGVPDAFGNPGHKGIDIPAPEGTPIYAAHGGTVLIASENNSYGNQILLDSSNGLSTRYAHMSGFAVSAGEAVSSGQIIGYVGSTGASTGNHLHFEVIIDGVLTDPLSIISKY